MTNIEWTDVTDNIFRVKGGGWWCRMISPGCANCYAAKINQSTFFGGNQRPYTGAAPEMELRTDIIDGWQRMRTPKKHFVASMTDVFGEWVTEAQAITFLRGMWRAPEQTFQLLTKRPAHAYKLVKHWLAHDMLERLPDNIWIGTSVEDQRRAAERIPELLRIPARVRFLSVEPMLGPVDFDAICTGPPNSGFAVTNWLGQPDGEGENQIHWVIFGGESGPGARPCSIEWIRSGIKQCQAAGVPCFTKQLGRLAVGPNMMPNGPHKILPLMLKDKKGGDMAEWEEDLRVRQWPVPEAAA